MIKIRLQKISDAERFYEILNNDNYKDCYLYAKVI